MEITQEQKLNMQVIQKAWEDPSFMEELMSNPIPAMENLTGEKIALPQGQNFVVVDQSDPNTTYFNIPRNVVEVDNLQLTEEQLEMVAGGLSPSYFAFAIGFGAAMKCWDYTH